MRPLIFQPKYVDNRFDYKKNIISIKKPYKSKLIRISSVRYNS